MIMGVRGSRKGLKKSDEYKEPDLLVCVDDVYRKAKKSGFYDGNVLKIEDLISTFSDIEIEYKDMDSADSGSLSYDKKKCKWIMCVNRKHNIKRQRFTMAHELGHYILHKEKNVEFVDTTFFRNSEKDAVEYNANEFASRLLMPESEVRTLIDVDGVKNIGNLAEKFNVSAAAMKYRVISLGYKIKGNV